MYNASASIDKHLLIGVFECAGAGAHAHAWKQCSAARERDMIHN